jgi:hypothetical protein
MQKDYQYYTLGASEKHTRSTKEAIENTEGNDCLGCSDCEHTED